MLSHSAGRLWTKRLLPVAVSIGSLTWLFAYGGINFHDVADAMNWRIALTLIPSLLAYGLVALLIEAKSILWLVETPADSFNTWTAARIKSASYLLSVVNYALGIGRVHGEPAPFCCSTRVRPAKPAGEAPTAPWPPW